MECYDPKIVWFLVSVVAVFVGAAFILMRHEIANLTWRIEGLKNQIAFKDECIRAARNNEPPPFPPGRILRMGMDNQDSCDFKKS